MSDPSVTFVVCVEAGVLEQTAVRLAGSLRRFGGRFSQAPFFAVKARLGPPLAPATLDAFKTLDVQFLQERPDRRYTWQNFMNKPAAILAVDRRAQTQTVCWLDSDTLVTAEPELLALEPGMDFAACSTSKDLASEGPDDPHEPFWIELCRIFGMKVDDLPWVETLRDRKRVRLHFNSGVFVYRRGKGFAEGYHEDCFKLLDARLVHRGAGITYADQVVLGLTMLRLGLAWRPLPRDYNYTIGEFMKKSWYVPDQIKAARILHYHRIMEPAHWATMVELMAANKPEVHAWLAPQGPIAPQLPSPGWRALAKGMWLYRRARTRLHYLRSRKL